MNILYYNLQLGSFDGSNAHASGMLAALRGVCGEEHVMVANHAQESTYNHKAQVLKMGLGKALDPVRMARKRVQSRSLEKDAVARARERGFAPDILLARATLYDTAPQRIARELGCKLVVEANTPLEYECCDTLGVSLRSLVRSFERGLLGAADGVYAVSSVLKQMYVEGYGVDPAKIKVIPNGYAAPLYHDFDNRSQIRAEKRSIQGVNDAFVVAFVGSLQTWHGIGRLIEIAEFFRNKPTNRRIVFWVMGDGRERDAVERYAGENQDFVWFGNVDPETMKRCLYAADLGIMPYEDLERFYFSPLKMYDMVGAGLPFIGLDIGQIGEVVRVQLGGRFLVGGTDARAYGQRIEQLVECPDELAIMQERVVAARPAMTWNARAAELATWMERL